MKIMGKTIGLLTAALLLPVMVQAQTMQDEVRQAIGTVGTDVQAALQKSAAIPKNQPVALLPIANDPGLYVAGILKNAITATGMTCIEAKDDPFMDEVLKEVEWSERKSDMLDPATLTKFGKLKAAKLLMYGTVRDVAFDGRKGFVEIELHVSAIETKQHLWGQTFARRFYVAQNMKGFVQLDDAARKTLAQLFGQCLDSLKMSAAARGEKKSVIIVPLAGDMDRYVTQLAEGMLTKTGALVPREQDAQTMVEAKQLLRDQAIAADAILYGALRDLYKHEKFKETADTTINKVYAEVQLKLIAAKTGDVLWSDTVRTEYDEVIKKDTMQELVDKKKKEVLTDLLNTGTKDPGKTAWGIGKIVLVVLGLFFGGMILLWFLRLMMRPR